MAGELMRAEIYEQPEALRRLVAQTEMLDDIERALASFTIRDVRLIAHGSSDNAASFGVYSFGLLAKRTAFRDTISLPVYYEAEMDLSDSLVVAISQSGRTPDVVEHIEKIRGRGALTLAITNDPDSRLARASDLVFTLAAGEEKAVAATKTYMSSLAALALVAGMLGSRRGEVEIALHAVTSIMDEALPGIEEAATELATHYVDCQRLFVVGRGVELATARETALKLTETCRIVAAPLTVTDFAHGPIAAVDKDFPVWMVASHDPNLAATLEGARRAHDAGADIIACGSAAAEVMEADHQLLLPRAPIHSLSPLLSILPGQLFALALAKNRGLDPDAPPNLVKVTEAL